MSDPASICFPFSLFHLLATVFLLFEVLDPSPHLLSSGWHISLICMTACGLHNLMDSVHMYLNLIFLLLVFLLPTEFLDQSKEHWRVEWYLSSPAIPFTAPPPALPIVVKNTDWGINCPCWIPGLTLECLCVPGCMCVCVRVRVHAHACVCRCIFISKVGITVVQYQL